MDRKNESLLLTVLACHGSQRRWGVENCEERIKLQSRWKKRMVRQISNLLFRRFATCPDALRKAGPSRLDIGGTADWQSLLRCNSRAGANCIIERTGRIADHLSSGLATMEQHPIEP